MSRLEGNRSSAGNITFQKKGKDKLVGSQQQEPEQEKDSILQTWEEIEQIRRENKELRDEIDTEARMNNISGPVLEGKMEQIQEMSSLIAQKIEVESQKKRDLETLIQISQDNINNGLKKLNQSNGVALPQLQARIKQLEYKLEKTRGRHNESLAQINMLKEQVNTVRRERVIFSNVFKKLESDIKLKDEEFKKFMIEKMQVEVKKKSLDEELQKIKSRAKKEVINFKNEYQQIFNQNKQLNTTSADPEYNSNQKRIFDTEVLLGEQSHSVHNVTNGPHNSSILANPNTIGGSVVHNNNTSVLTNNNISIINNTSNPLVKNSPVKQHQSINLQSTQEELQKYQFMFQKVQKEVGIDDLEHLIYLFENIEQENNNLYESANHKSDEIDELKKKIKDVEKEINRFSKHKDQKLQCNTQQDKKPQEVQKLLKKIENTEIMTKSVNTDIQTVTAKLMKIAEKYNIPKPVGELDDTNFIVFLKDVESKINDIINMALYCEGKIVNIDRQRETQGTAISINKKENNGGISQVLEGIKKKSEPEAERILTKETFEGISKEEIKQFAEFKGKMQTTSKGKKQKL